MPTLQLPLVVDYAAEEERLPLSIKIALGDNLVEVIGAGTKLPTTRELEVSNAADDQEQLTIRVVQGASNRPEANAKVASYVIGGLAKAPRGTLSISIVLEVTLSLGFKLSAHHDGEPYEVVVQDQGRPLTQKAIAALMDEEEKDAVPPFDGTYDRAEYHKQSVADEGLEPKQAYVHSGMFLGWLVESKLLSEEFLAKAGEGVQQFKARTLTGPKLYELWQGVLTEEMLSEEGNAFARNYFDFRRGEYLEDYEELLAPAGATLLAVEDKWEHFHALSLRLNERYEAWKEERANPSE
jgi:hypothetical protein